MVFDTLDGAVRRAPLRGTIENVCMLANSLSTRIERAGRSRAAGTACVCGNAGKLADAGGWAVTLPGLSLRAAVTARRHGGMITAKLGPDHVLLAFNREARSSIGRCSAANGMCRRFSPDCGDRGTARPVRVDGDGPDPRAQVQRRPDPPGAGRVQRRRETGGLLALGTNPVLGQERLLGNRLINARTGDGSRAPQLSDRIDPAQVPSPRRRVL